MLTVIYFGQLSNLCGHNPVITVCRRAQDVSGTQNQYFSEEFDPVSMILIVVVLGNSIYFEHLLWTGT